ncbi:MAG: YHS domain-containing protein [bacterium]
MEENEVKDPVCGMTVKKDEAAATSEHMGKTFYFCCPVCKEKFDSEPMKYMGKEEEGGMSGSCH